MSKKTREDFEKVRQAQAYADLVQAGTATRNRHTEAAFEAQIIKQDILNGDYPPKIGRKMFTRAQEIFNMVLLIGVLAFLGYVIFL